MNLCVCKRRDAELIRHEYVEVALDGSYVEPQEGLEVLRCNHCGVVRLAHPPFDSDDGLLKFYHEYIPSKAGYVQKDYQHDRKVASLRAAAYGIVGQDKRVLDVGSGSGAFVDVCREGGLDAYGCEIAEYDYSKDRSNIYQVKFEENSFPTEHFDIVTCHDVIEHSTNPVRFIAELARVTKERCYVELPDFQYRHHWKWEHLWYFTPEQLKQLLENGGFKVTEVRKPIETKYVLCCEKKQIVRPKILLPPGIGDSYWSIVKLRSFLKKERLALPDVSVASPRSLSEDIRNRSFPFLEMIPFIRSSWNTIGTFTSAANQAIWNEAYRRPGRTIFRNILGNDYFIAYNGQLRVGRSLEHIDPDLQCEWRPNLFVSKQQEKYKTRLADQLGKYAVFYFVFHGTYKRWIAEFSINELVESVNKIIEKTGLTPVLVGASWDNEESLLAKVASRIKGAINMIGDTSMTELFGLLRGAEVVVGFPSGLTIMSTVLGTKTVCIWNDYYNRDFAWHAMPPDTYNRTYFVENTKGLTVSRLEGLTVDVLAGKNVISRLPVPGYPTVMVEPDDGNLLARKRMQGKKDKLTINPPKTQADRQLRIRSKIIGVRPAHKSSRSSRSEQNCATLCGRPKTVLLHGSGVVQVACVLRTGKKYNDEYPVRLKKMVERNTTVAHEFLTLTNSPSISGQTVIPLKYNFEGWWSKLELFQLHGPVLYLDLDTIVYGNIDHILRAVHSLKEKTFMMLPPFNNFRKRNGLWASGIMAWNGDFRFLLDEYSSNQKAITWDQVYITKSLKRHGVKIRSVMDFAKILSFKRHCSQTKLAPKGADLICFHGDMRPDNVNYKWVQEAWR